MAWLASHLFSSVGTSVAILIGRTRDETEKTMFESEARHRRRIGAVIVAIFLAVLFFSTASAQWTSNLERELEKTDEMIERAADASRNAGSIMANKHLENAVKLQREAKRAYRGRMFQKSYKMTMSARDQINKAVAILKNSENNDSVVRRALERTNEILAQADEAITESGSLKAGSLFETSQKTQDEATRFFRGNRLKIAFKATLKARDIARRAIIAANSDINNEGRVRRELERTDELISRAREQSVQLGANGEVSQLLTNAEGIQSRAWESLTAGRLRVSVKQTMNARDVTKRALGIMERSSQPDRIESLLKQNHRLVERLKDILTDTPNPGVSRILEAAIAHQDNAIAAFKSKDFQTSMVEAKAARDLLLKAQSMPGR